MMSLPNGASREVPASLRHRRFQAADFGQPGLRRRTAGNPLGRGLLWIFLAAAQPLVDWQQRLRDRATLERMPDYILRDIGLDRATARREADKPFWQP